MHKHLWWIAGGAAALYVLNQRRMGSGGSLITPPGAQGFSIPASPSFPAVVGQLQPIQGGGYVFPILPAGRAYTTDPATGLVYETEIAVPSQPGYTSVSDVLRR